MAIKTGDLGSVLRTFKSMGRVITDPKHPDAYVTCCHAYTAKTINLNWDNIPSDMCIVLLGYKGEVLHSILVSADGEIAADTQRQVRNLDSNFNMQTGTYSSKMYAQSQHETHYDVLAIMSIDEFKRYLQREPAFAALVA